MSAASMMLLHLIDCMMKSPLSRNLRENSPSIYDARESRRSFFLFLLENAVILDSIHYVHDIISYRDKNNFGSLTTVRAKMIGIIRSSPRNLKQIYEMNTKTKCIHHL